MINLNSIKPYQTNQFHFKPAASPIPAAVGHDKVTNLNLSPKVYFMGDKNHTQRLLLPEEFKEKNENKLMMGTLSPELASLSSSENPEHEFPHIINEVASTFSLFPSVTPEEGKDINFKIKLNNGKTINSNYIDKGDFGRVFKIDNFAKDPYALKIDFNKDDVSEKGFWSELALADLIGGQRFKDLAHFEAGSPKYGWEIFEFISDDAKPEDREGASFEDFRKRHKLETVDHYEGEFERKNVINGIIYDYGGVIQRKKIVQRTQDEIIEDIKNGNLKTQLDAIECIWNVDGKGKKDIYNTAFETKNSKVKVAAAENIWILRTNDRKDAYYKAWDTENSEIQAAAARNIGSLKVEDRKDAFDKAWNTGDLKIQAAATRNIKNLETHDRKDAYYTAIDVDDQEVQAATISNIEFLKLDDRQGAYYEAWNKENPEMQTVLATNIKYLDKGDRKTAYYKALKTKNPKAQVNAVKDLGCLLETDRKKAYSTALKAKSTEVKMTAAKNIVCLKDNKEKKSAYYKAFNTGVPDVQVAAVENIGYLAEKDREKAYYKAIKTGVPKVQVAAVKNINILEKGNKRDAYNAAIKTKNMEAQLIAVSQLGFVPEKLDLDIPQGKFAYISSIELDSPRGRND